jgi:hypothetical protein
MQVCLRSLWVEHFIRGKIGRCAQWIDKIIWIHDATEIEEFGDEDGAGLEMGWEEQGEEEVYLD